MSLTEKDFRRLMEKIQLIEKENESLNAQIQQLKFEQVSLKKRVNEIEQGGSSHDTSDVEIIKDHLRKLSCRQHVIMQLIATLPRFSDVANRVGVSENTVKTQVQRIYQTIEVRGKADMIMWLKKAMKMVSDEAYISLSGGLPSRWAKEYAEVEPDSDPYYVLYRPTLTRGRSNANSKNRKRVSA